MRSMTVFFSSSSSWLTGLRLRLRPRVLPGIAQGLRMRPLCEMRVRKQQFQFSFNSEFTLLFSLVFLLCFLAQSEVRVGCAGRGRAVQTFDVCFDASQNITNIIDLVIAGYVTYVPCKRAFCPRSVLIVFLATMLDLCKQNSSCLLWAWTVAARNWNECQRSSSSSSSPSCVYLMRHCYFAFILFPIYL